MTSRKLKQLVQSQGNSIEASPDENDFDLEDTARILADISSVRPWLDSVMCAFAVDKGMDRQRLPFVQRPGPATRTLE